MRQRARRIVDGCRSGTPVCLIPVPVRTSPVRSGGGGERIDIAGTTFGGLVASDDPGPGVLKSLSSPDHPADAEFSRR